MRNKTRYRLPVFFLLTLLLASPGAAGQSQTLPAERLDNMLQYISAGWKKLTRSLDECETVIDKKRGDQSILYLPAGYPVPERVRALQKKCRFQVEHLPQKVDRLGQMDMSAIQTHGLLYLEHDYVVPGGFFNEMYGWDSYFILRGLVRDGELELARGMVENFFFEIEHYGAILNANRSYFLTRSQPPFLTSMILAVYEADKAKGKEDNAWLRRAYDYAVRDHQLWVREEHLAGDTGLSRYFDFGQGPAPEVLWGEDRLYTYLAQQFLRDPALRQRYLTPADKQPKDWPVFTVQVCEEPSEMVEEKDRCRTVQQLGLTAEFYKGDRSMRESGFDVSSRFGPFSADTHHYAAVCLNSLLYKAETDLEQMSLLLGRSDEAARWRKRARERGKRMQRYFWDAKRGMFFDWNAHRGQRSDYVFASTFYPLWVGAATPEQAKAVVANLRLFEKPGGVVMSVNETKAQWDFPYGWAPIQLIAIEGLRNYGYHAEADRLSESFITTVLENFERDGTIREKYNMVTRSSETDVEAGYRENVIGFGWTNGVVLELLHGLQTKSAAQAVR